MTHNLVLPPPIVNASTVAEEQIAYHRLPAEIKKDGEDLYLKTGKPYIHLTVKKIKRRRRNLGFLHRDKKQPLVFSNKI